MYVMKIGGLWVVDVHYEDRGIVGGRYEFQKDNCRG